MPTPPSYEFSPRPHMIATRSKLRPDSLKEIRNSAFHTNIHHDPRVARGITFAGDRRSDVDPAKSSNTEVRPRAGTRRVRKKAGRLGFRGATSSLFQSHSNEQHAREELDLSRYLIEPGEGTIRPELDVETQTDVFEDRPQTPDFLPRSTGVDVSTQIEKADNLFDFYAEIQPLLNVLVGKTLEQARIEVEREHEVESIRGAAITLIHQRADEERRISRLKEAAVVAEREKEELRQRRRADAMRRRLAKEKVACLQLMRQMLPLSLSRALEELSKDSWTTPTADQIKNVFWPWLFESVATDLSQRCSIDATLTGLVASVQEMAETARFYRTEGRRVEAEERERAGRIARERPVRLFIPAELAGGEEGEKLGPIAVTAGDSLSAGEARIREWLLRAGGVEDVAIPDGGFFNGYWREAKRRCASSESRRVTGTRATASLLDLQEYMGSSDEILLKLSFERA